MHRLLCNTLPAPIVSDIALGRVEVAHRYEQVTVLQSDMRGFTVLSAALPPETVLGILSDMFAKFDVLASHYGVHKVKTIGDAYVAVGGAFTLSNNKPEAALRMVKMGLAMADVVQTTASSKSRASAPSIVSNGVSRRSVRSFLADPGTDSPKFLSES